MDEITTADQVEATLSLIILLLVFATHLWTIFRPRLRGTAVSFLLLGALAAVTVAHGIAIILAGQWFAFMLTPLAVASLVVAGEVHITARRKRPSRVVAWGWRRIEQKVGIPPRQTLDSLRVEYAQTILDDAKHDPALNMLLNLEVDLILKTLSDNGRKQPTVEDVTQMANAWVSRMSDPQYEPSKGLYLRYSTDMLVVAAACRSVDRL